MSSQTTVYPVLSYVIVCEATLHYEKSNKAVMNNLRSTEKELCLEQEHKQISRNFTFTSSAFAKLTPLYCVSAPYGNTTLFEESAQQCAKQQQEQEEEEEEEEYCKEASSTSHMRCVIDENAALRGILQGFAGHILTLDDALQLNNSFNSSHTSSSSSTSQQTRTAFDTNVKKVLTSSQLSRLERIFCEYATFTTEGEIKLERLLSPFATEGVYIQVPSTEYIRLCHHQASQMYETNANNESNGKNSKSSKNDSKQIVTNVLNFANKVISSSALSEEEHHDDDNDDDDDVYNYYKDSEGVTVARNHNWHTKTNVPSAVLPDLGYLYGYAYCPRGTQILCSKSKTTKTAPTTLLVCVLSHSPCFNFMRQLTQETVLALREVYLLTCSDAIQNRLNPNQESKHVISDINNVIAPCKRRTIVANLIAEKLEFVESYVNVTSKTNTSVLPGQILPETEKVTSSLQTSLECINKDRVSTKVNSSNINSKDNNNSFIEVYKRKFTKIKMKKPLDVLYPFAEVPLSILLASFSFYSLRLLHTLLFMSLNQNNKSNNTKISAIKLFVISASPQQASACVTALPSLLAPVIYSNPIIPFISPHVATISNFLEFMCCHDYNSCLVGSTSDIISHLQLLSYFCAENNIDNSNNQRNISIWIADARTGFVGRVPSSTVNKSNVWMLQTCKMLPLMTYDGKLRRRIKRAVNKSQALLFRSALNAYCHQEERYENYVQEIKRITHQLQLQEEYEEEFKKYRVETETAKLTNVCKERERDNILLCKNCESLTQERNSEESSQFKHKHRHHSHHKARIINESDNESKSNYTNDSNNYSISCSVDDIDTLQTATLTFKESQLEPYSFNCEMECNYSESYEINAVTTTTNNNNSSSNSNSNDDSSSSTDSSTESSSMCSEMEESSFDSKGVFTASMIDIVDMNDKTEFHSNLYHVNQQQQEQQLKEQKESIVHTDTESIISKENNKDNKNNNKSIQWNNTIFSYANNYHIEYVHGALLAANARWLLGNYRLPLMMAGRSFHTALEECIRHDRLLQLLKAMTNNNKSNSNSSNNSNSNLSINLIEVIGTSYSLSALFEAIIEAERHGLSTFLQNTSFASIATNTIKSKVASEHACNIYLSHPSFRSMLSFFYIHAARCFPTLFPEITQINGIIYCEQIARHVLTIHKEIQFSNYSNNNHKSHTDWEKVNTQKKKKEREMSSSGSGTLSELMSATLSALAQGKVKRSTTNTQNNITFDTEKSKNVALYRNNNDNDNCYRNNDRINHDNRASRRKKKGVKGFFAAAKKMVKGKFSAGKNERNINLYSSTNHNHRSRKVYAAIIDDFIQLRASSRMLPFMNANRETCCKLTSIKQSLEEYTLKHATAVSNLNTVTLASVVAHAQEQKHHQQEQKHQLQESFVSKCGNNKAGLLPFDVVYQFADYHPLLWSHFADKTNRQFQREVMSTRKAETSKRDNEFYCGRLFLSICYNLPQNVYMWHCANNIVTSQLLRHAETELLCHNQEHLQTKEEEHEYEEPWEKEQKQEHEHKLNDKRVHVESATQETIVNVTDNINDNVKNVISLDELFDMGNNNTNNIALHKERQLHPYKESNNMLEESEEDKNKLAPHTFTSWDNFTSGVPEGYVAESPALMCSVNNGDGNNFTSLNANNSDNVEKLHCVSVAPTTITHDNAVMTSQPIAQKNVTSTTNLLDELFGLPQQEEEE